MRWAGVLIDPEIGAAGDIDTAVVTLRLANGALAVIDNSRQAVYGYDQRFEVFGSAGSVAVDNTTPSTRVVSTTRRGGRVDAARRICDPLPGSLHRRAQVASWPRCAGTPRSWPAPRMRWPP